jgi:hypothetical protein
MLIFLVLVMSVVFVIGAIAVDIGLWLSERRGAQTDADLAALAGGVELVLGGSPADAEAAATDNLAANDEQGNASFVNGTPDATTECVTVDVGHDSRPLLFQIFGIPAPDIGAHAKACIITDSNLDIYAHDTGCATEPSPYPDGATSEDEDYANCTTACSGDTGIVFKGNGPNVEASMHSNNDIIVTGNDGDFTGPAGYVCTYRDTGNGNTWDFPPQPDNFVPWPLYVVRGEYDSCPSEVPPLCAQVTVDIDNPGTPGPDYCNAPNVYRVTGPINESTPGVWQSPGVLKPQILCSDPGVDITITRNDGVAGNVTIVSGRKINITTQTNVNLNSFASGVVLFGDSPESECIRFSGNNAVFTGLIFCELGEINMKGNNMTFNEGGILGDRVVIESQGAVDFFLSVIPGERSLVLVE